VIGGFHVSMSPAPTEILETRLHHRVGFLLESAEVLSKEALAAYHARSVRAVIETLDSLRSLLAKELPTVFNLVLNLQSQLSGLGTSTVEFRHFVAMLGIREWTFFGQAASQPAPRSIGDPVLSAEARLVLLARMTAEWNATFREAAPSVEVSSRAVRVLGPIGMHLRIIEQML
jgi:hypothetical protein